MTRVGDDNYVKLMIGMRLFGDNDDDDDDGGGGVWTFLGEEFLIRISDLERSM